MGSISDLRSVHVGEYPQVLVVEVVEISVRSGAVKIVPNPVEVKAVVHLAVIGPSRRALADDPDDLFSSELASLSW